MFKRIVIAGAGGFGRAVYSWLMQSPRHRETANICDIVFIDDSTPLAKTQAPVISTIRDYVPVDGDEVLVSVGVPNIRRNIVETLTGRSVQFHTFVDDRAVIAQGVRLGLGTIICPGTVIDPQVTISPHVQINKNCSVGHDTVLGAFTTVSPMTNIMGEVSIGTEVFVGGSAALLPRICVGDRAIIGAGATVVRSVQSEWTVVGNPARQLSK